MGPAPRPWLQKRSLQRVRVRADNSRKMLPRRLLLDAFSPTLGWRPSGVQTGQVKTYATRFVSEFSIAALGQASNFKQHDHVTQCLSEPEQQKCPWPRQSCRMMQRQACPLLRRTASCPAPYSVCLPCLGPKILVPCSMCVRHHECVEDHLC